MMDDAIDTLICSYSRLLSGLQDPSRPLLTALLLGPTGVGKTETAKALAQILFGSEMAMTRVNCEEYAHGHELSKLLGSPPGYVGYNIEPLLSQRRIDDPHRRIREEPQRKFEQGNSLIDRIFTSDEDKFLSILLFDEVEKAHPILWNTMLGILDAGMLTLGDNSPKALAQTLFGSEMAMTRVNCEEYAHGHELSKLLGSPPGYVGYNIEPLLSQRRIDDPHRRIREEPQRKFEQGNSLIDRIFTSDEDKFLSILLFDEVEKAHPILWNTMLGILDSGMLTLGDNTTTDFSQSIILMTSNVGSREMSEILDRGAIGFHQDDDSAQVEAKSIRETALRAARKAFPMEFLNRFDEILVYSALEREHLEKIFDKFLADFHARAMNQAGVPILIKVDQKARNLIIDRGIDHRYGARPLRRAMERELVDPISRLMASQKLHPGDVVEVEREAEHLVFYRKQRYSEALVV